MEFDLPTLIGIADVNEELEDGGSYRFILWTDGPAWAVVVRNKRGQDIPVCSATGGVVKFKVRLHSSADAFISTMLRIDPAATTIPDIPMYPDNEFPYSSERRSMLDDYIATRTQKLQSRFKIDIPNN